MAVNLPILIFFKGVMIDMDDERKEPTRDEMMPALLESLDSFRKFKVLSDKYMNPRLEDTGITVSNAPFLLALDDKEGRSLKEITEHMGVNKSLTSRMMIMLSCKGLVKNVGKTLKEYSVILTAKGVQAKKRLEKEFRETVEIITAPFSDQELAELMVLMNKLALSVDKLMSDEN